MKTRNARSICLFLTASLALPGCGGSDAPPTDSQDGDAGGGPSTLRLTSVTNGFGQILPHRAPERNSDGTLTGNLVDIRSIAQFKSIAVDPQSILPPSTFPNAAQLPNSRPGNHFLLAQFSSAIDPASVFDLGNGTGLLPTVSLTSFDSATGVRSAIPARVLVGGVTAVDRPGGSVLEPWARPVADPDSLEALVPEAEGIPDVLQRGLLVGERSILLVADSDDDLLTFETFPDGVQLNLRVIDVLNTQGNALEDSALASTTVGLDTQRPRPEVDSMGALLIEPANGALDVDPQTELLLAFSEPVQPWGVGKIDGAGFASISGALDIAFGPPTARTEMPYTVEPLSPFDLSRYRVIPGYPFPGAPAPGVSTPFTLVDVICTSGFTPDLAQNTVPTPASSQFETGFGPGLINAPVIPEAILAFGPGSAGSDRLSVIDLNGFGASTGNPVSSPGFPLEGESRFPYDPNVLFNPSVRPPLQPGTTTIDGGSAGVFTLTLDSTLQPELVGSTKVDSIADVHSGHPLDGVFRNAPPPFGCQAGGGEVCALDGLKVIAIEFNGGNGMRPRTPTAFGGLNPGYGNIVSMSPHPNPPPLVFPPLCAAPLLLGQEPTSVSTTGTNLLVPGNPFPDPATGAPPTGLLTLEQNAFFVGPTHGEAQLSNCETYMIRQQVGHFVYVADRAANEIVVLNSNRMSVVERIPVPDPTSMAMSPNLDFIAVTSELADTVTFIDINPSSAFFHDARQTVIVGDAPHGVAWSPSNEDILVCNEGDDSLTVIGANSLQVRLTVAVPASGPFEVSITPREVGFGFDRAVYLGYVLCRDGSVAVFESGPNGPNGWGFDDIIGVLPYSFQSPKAIQSDRSRSADAVAIVHEGPIDPLTGASGMLGDGAITRVFIDQAQVGAVPLLPGEMPGFRQTVFGLETPISMSTGQLSGIPTDIAFDEMANLGGLPGLANVFSAGSPLPGNGKGLMKRDFPALRRATGPVALFAAVPGQGVVDVIDMGAPSTPVSLDVDPYRAGTQSIIAPGVSSLSSYWRQ